MNILNHTKSLSSVVRQSIRSSHDIFERLYFRPGRSICGVISHISDVALGWRRLGLEASHPSVKKNNLSGKAENNGGALVFYRFIEWAHARSRNTQFHRMLLWVVSAVSNDGGVKRVYKNKNIILRATRAMILEYKV